MRPILFSLGPFSFQTSPLIALASAICAHCYVWRRRGYARLSEERFWRLALWLAIGTLLGGFLLYTTLYGDGLTENLAAALRGRRPPPGSFLGNLAGAYAAAWLFHKTDGAPFARLADLLGAASMIGLSIMRLGCLMQGCCHGIATGASWGLVFSHPRSAVENELAGIPLYPTQLIESAGAAAIAALVHFLVLPRIEAKRLPAGCAALASLSGYALLRFSVDFLRGRDPGLWRPFGLTTAQALCVLIFCASAFLWTRNRRARR